MLGDLLHVTLTASVGSAATTAPGAWAQVHGYPRATTSFGPGNQVNVDLTYLGSKAPADVMVFVQTAEKWPKGPGDNWG
jgi:hypothetical protein